MQKSSRKKFAFLNERIRKGSKNIFDKILSIKSLSFTDTINYKDTLSIFFLEKYQNVHTVRKEENLFLRKT